MRANISVTREINKTLIEEFNVSRATVNNALNYRFDSQKASKIRMRAKILLEENAKQASELVDSENV